jgi:hypothetical protein
LAVIIAIAMYIIETVGVGTAVDGSTDYWPSYLGLVEVRFAAS